MNKSKNKGFTLIELIICIVICVIFGALLFGSIRGCSGNFSEGSRVGQVTKLSKKGVSNKTWEGELNLGSMRNATDSEGRSTLSANVWEFTIPNDRQDLVDAVQAAMDKNLTVRIRYIEKGYSSPFEGDTRYRVVEVIPVK
jgi:prepilin-type N-terminal cleavage/methylation domain-containing protein